MKAILISIRPEWVVLILNGLKTVEIRKMFPSDYVGWVYIYCTKGTKDFLCEVDNYKELHEKGLAPFRYYLTSKRESKYHKCLNGKVVARFWCDKVGEIHFVAASLASKRIVDWNCDEIYAFEKYACLAQEDLDKYLGKVRHSPQGKAIRVTEVDPFDKPKEIYEMKQLEHFGIRNKCEMLVPITCAPQSWCYVEV